MTEYQLFELPGLGPEDVVADGKGWLYTGLEDGRVLKIDPVSKDIRTLVTMEGRPLGMEVTDKGRLLICCSPGGLYELDLASNSLRLLAAMDGDETLPFCSNVIAGPGGEIYFTVSSMRHEFSDWKVDFTEGLHTGRAYRLNTDGSLDLLARDLAFANGLVLAPSGDYLVVAETLGRRLQKLYLDGSKAGRLEPFVEFEAYPDNLGVDDGVFWVSLASERNRDLEKVHKIPLFLRRVVARLPEAVQPKPKRMAWVEAYDFEGNRVHRSKWTDGVYATVTSVCRVGDRLWCGSITEESLLTFELDESVGAKSRS
ncbi:MAG: SMP-30/gluconolactonase/LRE family protein [Pseudomonadota bacterium]